jgi:Skp family chaperone for outer membrane proteins
VNRAMVYLSALVGVGGMVLLAGQAQAQAPAPAGNPPAATPPPAASPAPRAGGKVAVFNVARVMKDYQKWQYYAAVMNQKRTTAAAELNKVRNDIVTLQEQMNNPGTPKAQQEEIAKQVLAKQRQFEDRERQVRTELDNESAQHLQGLFHEIQRAVVAIAEQNGFDIVFAYPDAVTPEEMKSPMYYDLKLRPQAAMPFHVNPSADMTAVLVETLNKNFPAPGPIPGVTPAGGTQPAAPTPPPPGTPPPTPPGPGGM